MSYIAFLKVAYGVTRERKTDDGDCRTDYYCGHELIYPVYACKLDYDCENNINETCENRTEDKTYISERCRSCTCESREHGADECE